MTELVTAVDTCGVVSVARRGRMAHHRLADANVGMLLDLGLAHARHAGTPHAQRNGARS